MGYLSAGLFAGLFALALAYRALLLENAALRHDIEKAHASLEKQNEQIRAKALEAKEYQAGEKAREVRLREKYKETKAAGDLRDCEGRLGEIERLLERFTR